MLFFRSAKSGKFAARKLTDGRRLVSGPGDERRSPSGIQKLGAAWRAGRRMNTTRASWMAPPSAETHRPQAFRPDPALFTVRCRSSSLGREDRIVTSKIEGATHTFRPDDSPHSGRLARE